MAWLVKLIGIVMVAMGAIYLVKPSIMKKYAKFWAKKKRMYVGGVLSLIIGVIFLFAAPQCRVSWFVVLMGLVAILKGILAFIWGQKKSAEIIDKMIHSPERTLRILSLVTLGLGVALIFAVA
jgi:uncharacterized protein YjeT (DUF2065 family)